MREPHCEFCEDPITDEEFDEGEYGHQVVMVYGEIDDEFYWHKRCEDPNEQDD
jgi:hypothetical protein